MLHPAVLCDAMPSYANDHMLMLVFVLVLVLSLVFAFVPCYAMLCHDDLSDRVAAHRVFWHCTALCHIMPCRVMQCDVMPCRRAPRCGMSCRIAYSVI